MNSICSSFEVGESTRGQTAVLPHPTKGRLPQPSGSRGQALRTIGQRSAQHRAQPVADDIRYKQHRPGSL